MTDTERFVAAIEESRARAEAELDELERAAQEHAGLDVPLSREAAALFERLGALGEDIPVDVVPLPPFLHFV